jgi:hypothetical protein
MFAGGPTQDIVGVYPAYRSNPPPLREITSGVDAPAGMAVDALGNLYVCNNDTSNVSVYKRGATAPFVTYTHGVANPVDVAVAADESVFVANYSSTVTVYPKGSVDPSRTLKGPPGEAPLGIAFDSGGNVFVSYVKRTGSGGSIYEYAPGQDAGSDLGIVFSGWPHGVAVDPQGNLLVAVSKAPRGSYIEIFPPGSTQRKQLITAGRQLFMLALDKHSRRLYAADFGTGNGDGGVFEFAYPSGTLITKDDQGPAGSAYGVAIDGG